VLLCLASLKGSPGVTTLGVALSARWPQPWRRVLVEADPAGGDLAARYRLALAPGLISLAAAARRSTDAALVGEHTQTLVGGLAVVVGPTRPDQARAALTAITGADGRAGVLGSYTGRDDVVAVVDCGRLDPDGPAGPIIVAADQLLILARPRADELAHVADQVISGIVDGPARTRLLLVGPGYPAAEVTREVGLSVAGTVPWDPRTAAAVSGQGARTPRPRAALVRTATRLANKLAGDPRRIGSGPADHAATDPAPEGVPDPEEQGKTLPGPWTTVSPNGSGPPRRGWP